MGCLIKGGNTDLRAELGADARLETNLYHMVETSATGWDRRAATGRAKTVEGGVA